MSAARLWTYAALAALVFAAFASAFGNGFTNWDDPAYITENRLVWGLSWERIGAAFTSFQVSNYNPLHIVSYMLDHALWGLEPRGFLLTNLLLHAISGCLAWALVRELSGKAAVAWFAAIVFLVHPTRCESVVWLSERKDVLSGAFALAAALLYARGLAGARRRGALDAWMARGPYFAALGFFLLALLSKSQSVTLPLALGGLSLIFRRSWRVSIVEQAPFLALSALFSWITLQAQASGAPAAGAGAAGLSLVRPLAALSEYALHLAAPLGLSPYYQDDRPGWADLARWLPGLALLAAGLALAVCSYRRQRIAFAGVVWFAALLLPVSGVMPNLVLVADRYLYLPILGLAWAAGEALARVPARALLPGAAAAAACACGALSFEYAAAWKDSESLWRRVLERRPGCDLALSSLGVHCLGAGRVEEAERLFEEDLAARPVFRESYLGLAEIHRRAGRADAARALYEEVLERDGASPAALAAWLSFVADVEGPDRALERWRALSPPASFETLRVLARLHLDLGDALAARDAAMEAVRCAPFHEEAWYHLGLAEERQGDAPAAMAAYRRAADSSSRFQPAFEAAAALSYRQGDAAGALAILDRAPERSAPWWNLAAVSLVSIGETEAGQRAIAEATRLAPHVAEYWANRARVALRAGRREGARESIGRAVREDPRLASSVEPELRALIEE
jgi:tetratricopeptide (TPR) repeat protein